MMPITLGTTSRIPPATPDLAGSPTWKADQWSIIRSGRSQRGRGAAAGTDVEGELAGKVVHSAGVHQTESVPHRLRAQHTLACDGAEAAVGQGRRHDAGALAGHLDGAQLTRKDTKTDLPHTNERRSGNRS